MKTPFSRFRITAYHMVEASSGPWIRSQGNSIVASGGAVAIRPS